MKFKETLKTLTNASVYFFAIVFIIAVVIGGIRKCNHPIDELPSMIERNNKIDSISKVNQVIIIEVNQLDSIKNVEVIEVKNLDNDSTLKLFYQLIRE